ncbi:MAG: putative molybdenum carrier protein [Deltaproteobacteria bacterium]|nr:putative molybdenum carrier protein [Deltaproteobacteria bacterium]
MTLLKIVSGGQTGVDRAALDAALDTGFPCGGWCPKGRRAEDGVLDARYPLTETPVENYEQRTEWNARDADGTLILTRGEPTGGTAYTIDMARKHGKPWIVLDPAASDAPARAQAWLAEHAIQTLNVAGPRASKDADIYALSYKVVLRLIR